LIGEEKNTGRIAGRRGLVYRATAGITRGAKRLKRGHGGSGVGGNQAGDGYGAAARKRNRVRNGEVDDGIGVVQVLNRESALEHAAGRHRRCGTGLGYPETGRDLGRDMGQEYQRQESSQKPPSLHETRLPSDDESLAHPWDEKTRPFSPNRDLNAPGKAPSGTVPIQNGLAPADARRSNSAVRRIGVRASRQPSDRPSSSGQERSRLGPQRHVPARRRPVSSVPTPCGSAGSPKTLLPLRAGHPPPRSLRSRLRR
jgi:hypothetical protein